MNSKKIASSLEKFSKFKLEKKEQISLLGGTDLDTTTKYYSIEEYKSKRPGMTSYSNITLKK